jgi:hypothetical protein
LGMVFFVLGLSYSALNLHSSVAGSTGFHCKL